MQKWASMIVTCVGIVLLPDIIYRAVTGVPLLPDVVQLIAATGAVVGLAIYAWLNRVRTWFWLSFFSNIGVMAAVRALLIYGENATVGMANLIALGVGTVTWTWCCCVFPVADPDENTEVQGSDV